MDIANDKRVNSDAALSPRHQEVERLAFRRWQERGCPIGTPEIDWLGAEEELKASGTEEAPVLFNVAKAIGSTLGSVAALLNNNVQHG